MIKLGMQGRKWEIFESSIYLFAKKGYENVSMREIAAANGIRAASLYNHFISKETLLELMYEFYFKNIKSVTPDLQEIIDSIPKKTTREVLHMCMSYFDDELQPLMDSIYLVAIAQSNRDPRAFEVIWKNNFEHAKYYICTVLQKMIELQKIEPINLNIFSKIFSSFAFTAVFLNRSTNPFGGQAWMEGLDMIFSLVKEIPSATVSEG